MDNKIATRIVEDAVRLANSTREEGSAKAQETIDRALNDVNIFLQKNLTETEALRAEILKRKESVARLEVKKLMLGAKKTVLDATFERAIHRILDLPKEEYLAIIEAMLASAEDGDTVYIAERDSLVITAKFVADVAKKRGIKLTLAPTYVDIRGGIMLSNANYDKNLSLETELQALREEIEPDIAGALFGDNL